MTTEAILERMMSDRAFAEQILTNPEAALAGCSLSEADRAALKAMTRADFTQYASATPEERRSFTRGMQHNEAALG